MRALKKLKFGGLIKKAVIDSNYYLISQVSAKLLTVLIIPFLARRVSVEAFGEYDVFLLYSGFLLLIATLGIDSGIGLFIVESKGEKKNLKFYYTISQVVGIISIATLYLLCALIQSFFIILPESLFGWIFLNLLFSFIAYSSFNFLRWIGKARAAAIITFLSTTFGVLFGIALMLLLKSKEIKWFIIGLVFGNAISAVICLYITRSYLSLKSIRNRKNEMRDLFKVSLPFLPSYLINNLMIISDRILIVSFLGFHSYGLYAIVSRVAAIPAFGIQAISKGFLPVLFHNHDTEEGKAFNRRVFNTFIVSLLPLFIFFLMSGDWLIELFGGEKYHNIGYLVPAIMLSVLFYSGMSFNGFGFTIRRKTLIVTYITGVALLVNILLTVASIGTFKLAGVALSIMLSTAITSFIYTKRSETLYKIGYNLNLMIVIYILLCSTTIFYTIFKYSTMQ